MIPTERITVAIKTSRSKLPPHLVFLATIHLDTPNAIDELKDGPLPGFPFQHQAITRTASVRIEKKPLPSLKTEP
jgi:hypothetical protein